MEIAGLTLSAVGVAALFTTCIECFDIVVAGKDFSEDYEQLCALVRRLPIVPLYFADHGIVLFATRSIRALGRVSWLGSRSP